MGDTEAFYLTNCHRVVAENTVNGGKVGVCVREKEEQRGKKKCNNLKICFCIHGNSTYHC